MKVRTGFVSNSSSTSFTVLGWYSDEEIKDYVNKEYFFDNAKFIKSLWGIEVMNSDELWHDVRSYQILEFLEEELDLSIHTGYDGEGLYIGICPTFCGLGEKNKKYTDHEKIDLLTEKLKSVNQYIQDSQVFNEKFKYLVRKNPMSMLSECWREG